MSDAVLGYIPCGYGATVHGILVMILMDQNIYFFRFF